ncbi:hypothetical protein Psuf_054050 [Phytohabitans suffuscus]|uniref:HTH araC/xylS-type domain-containing protein n=1 Tax=Phytohabitans suffuscus TaxID=624315 RepID=A0A6F8YPN9_9ACTN|nr:hypothetical protein Psuf_054050 [Phytohabitans suffuscus]
MVGFGQSAGGAGGAGIATATLRDLAPHGASILDHHRLMLVTKGHGTHEVDFEVFPCRPGTLVWARPGQLVRPGGQPGLDATLVCWVPGPDLPERGPTHRQLAGEDEDAVINEVSQLVVDCERALSPELLRQQLATLLLRIRLLGPQPTETPRRTETPQPAETRRPAETPRHIETPQRVETSQPTEARPPTQTPQPTETPQRVETPQPTETRPPAETPQLAKTPRPSETPRLSETAQPSETPRPGETRHHTETRHTETRGPTETRRHAATPQATGGAWTAGRGSEGEAETYTRFRDDLEQGFARTRRVEDYADRLGCCVRTLTRASLAATGRSAKQVIDDRVTLEARRLLAGTDLPVAEIGRRLGFPEPTNFGRFFQREAGQSPGAFRAAVTGDLVHREAGPSPAHAAAASTEGTTSPADPSPTHATATSTESTTSPSGPSPNHAATSTESTTNPSNPSPNHAATSTEDTTSPTNPSPTASAEGTTSPPGPGPDSAAATGENTTSPADGDDLAREYGAGGGGGWAAVPAPRPPLDPVTGFVQA